MSIEIMVKNDGQVDFCSKNSTFGQNFEKVDFWLKKNVRKVDFCSAQRL